MKEKRIAIGLLCLSCTLMLFACGDSGSSTGSSSTGSNTSTSSEGSDSRDNTPVVLTPEASGTTVYENDSAHIDASNASEGYVMVSYTGTNEKVKLQITCDGGTTYTYNLTGDGYETFPLSAGSGSYNLTVFENISGTQYSTCLSETIDVEITNEFGAFLYPNQYCWFTDSSSCVSKGEELASGASDDLDVVSNIYTYVVENISYNYDLAADVESGYLPVPDDTLSSGTGICLDYASLMAAMLRTQNIPTHLEVGYAGEAYHAWISVYITDVGWINGIIEFDGESWELMDPTFAANSSESSLAEFIGDGSNYTTKYIY